MAKDTKGEYDTLSKPAKNEKGEASTNPTVKKKMNAKSNAKTI